MKAILPILAILLFATFPSQAEQFGLFTYEVTNGEITITASVTEISLSRFRAGREAFIGCSGLTSIEVNPGNAVYASDEGVLLNAARTEVLYSPKGKQGAYTIPESITSTGFTSPAWNGCPAVRIDERACPAAPWLVSHGLPYDTDLNQDLNSDGVTLLMAYALGLDPTNHRTASVPLDAPRRYLRVSVSDAPR